MLITFFRPEASVRSKNKGGEGRAPWAPFLDPPLNTYNPHCKSFRLEICDISQLFTHFSQLFPAVGSESHFFILLEVGKSVVCKSHESP